MRNNLFLGFVLITFGVLFLLNNLDVADFGDLIRDYWPLIMIFWGISMLLRRRPQRESTPPPTTDQTSQSESLNESMLFGNIYTNVTSQSFRGGSVSSVFGDCNLDLSKAIFADGEHTLRVHGVFGTTVITLPKDCAASVSANSLLGTMEILGQRKDGLISDLKTMTPNFQTAAKRLRISVSKIFGSTTIS